MERGGILGGRKVVLVVVLGVSRLRPFRGTGSVCSDVRGCPVVGGPHVHEAVWAQLRSALVTPRLKKKWEAEWGPSYSASSHAFGIVYVPEFGWGCLRKTSQRRMSVVALTPAMSSYAHQKRKQGKEKKKKHTERLSYSLSLQGHPSTSSRTSLLLLLLSLSLISSLEFFFVV